MAKDSPAGFVTRVEVQLVTGEIIEPAVVQSISPWLFFEMGDEIQTRRVVVVRPEHIAKVEIKFIRADGKQPPGFQVKTPQDAI
jgi:hypothetical protein